MRLETTFEHESDGMLYRATCDVMYDVEHWDPYHVTDVRVVYADTAEPVSPHWRLVHRAAREALIAAYAQYRSNQGKTL